MDVQSFTRLAVSSLACYDVGSPVWSSHRHFYDFTLNVSQAGQLRKVSRRGGGEEAEEEEGGGAGAGTVL